MTEALRMARGRVAAAGTGLRLDDVSVTYRTGLTAIEDVSFAIPRATITALVGVNGSGKSTLPLATGTKPMIALNSVDLPEPLTPTSAVIVARGMAKLAASIAVRPLR